MVQCRVKIDMQFIRPILLFGDLKIHYIGKMFLFCFVFLFGKIKRFP